MDGDTASGPNTVAHQLMKAAANLWGSPMPGQSTAECEREVARVTEHLARLETLSTEAWKELRDNDQVQRIADTRTYNDENAPERQSLAEQIARITTLRDGLEPNDDGRTALAALITALEMNLIQVRELLAPKLMTLKLFKEKQLRDAQQCLNEAQNKLEMTRTQWDKYEADQKRLARLRELLGVHQP